MRTRALWLFPAVGILIAPSSLWAVPVHQWSQHFGDADEQSANSVAVDGSGNVFVTGYFSGTADFGGGPLTSAGGDIFVAAFGASGSHLWSRRFGDADFQEGQEVATDGSGNVVVTGYFSGTADFGGGPLTSTGSEDIFVAKFDVDGGHVWSRRFGTPTARPVIRLR